MTLVFKDPQVLVVSPGSDITYAQMGLLEALLPATVEIPTLVYRSGDKFAGKGEESDAVRPIQSGKIVDESAFHYFLKALYRTLSRNAPLPPALFLTTSLQWNRRQIERLVRYLFEEVSVPALHLCVHGVTTAYAYALTDCLVVDIGLNKTEVTSVRSFEADTFASRVAPLGGASVNAQLSEKLPQFDSELIEDLKLSGIVAVSGPEVDEQLEKVAENEDGMIDIAAIVASGRTREILEERERAKQGETVEVPNHDRETNSFVDRHGQQHTVGRERFVDGKPLISSIVDTVATVLSGLKPRQQQHAMSTLVITGRAASLPGLVAGLTSELESHLVVKPGIGDTSAKVGNLVQSAAAGPGTANGHPHQTPDDNDSIPQAPHSINVAHMGDHFPEWKGRAWERVSFLGAQIGAKQVFTAGLEGLFVARNDYNEAGPSCIWDIYPNSV